MLGLTTGSWEAVLRRFAQLVTEAETPSGEAHLAKKFGLSCLEVCQFLQMARQYRKHRLFRELQACYGRPEGVNTLPPSEIEAELVRHYGFSPVAARLYHRWLVEFAARIGKSPLAPGEIIFLAISADEGARAKLAEAQHIPLRLRYFTTEDALEGPYGGSRHRVAGLKFGRILRFATEARAQGALLTLPDLAVLMGIHVDAIRRQLLAHPEVVVPTRGRVKDIGRGVTHKTKIVELYLEMHTETEIVERTDHTYESVEAYLKEFARVVTLADQGLKPVMIRRVTGRSMALVQAYLDLYRRYNQPDYYFRLAQLRNVFARDETPGQKKGRLFRSPTGGAGL
ncbi:hypothetical protein Tph_c01370 [Thermacetogenium phaeum DSM 12270]|uniref:DUF1670 domain-containing protein n=1 Tax=Thermacetogenium phaeum (strain ATCC BAA-254 / DSM 26808 / PB) TaxID=1089553 RepID=K4LEJ3_THEPS|nr:DUF1670 domain-containing protein [Thermacetogenium phaeum]AFV10385.1 hypothetical protein Tph_c01370 [Thermacetogenium phaeum DSM 12270]